MTNFKLGRKQIYASSSSGLKPRKMDEPPSLSMDPKSLIPKEQVQPQSKVKVPHGKSSPFSNTDIDELLECPVCSNAMFPPIQQCPSGHTLCFTCKGKVNNRCPICRKEIGDIRCLALEKLAASVQLPCAYRDLGCNEILPYYSKLQHEASCVHRPYTCPHPGQECHFSGDIPELLSHIRESHKVDLQTGCTFNHRYVKQNPGSVDNCSWTLTLFNCFGHYFCLHFESFLLGSEPVYMAFLRFLGEESEARKFNYCLEVGTHGRKLKWQGVPRSIRTHHKIVRDSHDGLIIHRPVALHFSGGKQELKLRVSGKIWKELFEGERERGKGSVQREERPPVLM